MGDERGDSALLPELTQANGHLRVIEDKIVPSAHLMSARTRMGILERGRHQE